MACTESGLCGETAIRHTPPDCNPLPAPRCCRLAQSKGEESGDTESWRWTRGVLAQNLTLREADTKVHDRNYREARRGIPGPLRPLLASDLDRADLLSPTTPKVPTRKRPLLPGTALTDSGLEDR